ncbi:hypothetical protein J3R30DRAFT_3407847 [Lentinula aciculospora]|uniref:Uncharacterized protein n=1 Tax=Lentinula aciculospora TaxID=153920 RepID=A0A9W9DHX4_9AGAR|nr:hypothetical protein J3R30DRAFT_3407847 [Lentinula aciculospora]
MGTLQPQGFLVYLYEDSTSDLSFFEFIGMSNGNVDCGESDGHAVGLEPEEQDIVESEGRNGSHPSALSGGGNFVMTNTIIQPGAMSAYIEEQTNAEVEVYYLIEVILATTSGGISGDTDLQALPGSDEGSEIATPSVLNGASNVTIKGKIVGDGDFSVVGGDMIIGYDESTTNVPTLQHPLHGVKVATIEVEVVGKAAFSATAGNMRIKSSE